MGVLVRTRVAVGTEVGGVLGVWVDETATTRREVGVLVDTVPSLQVARQELEKE